MPYLYPVEVKESAISGKGLYAAKDIPKGAVYWVYQCQNPLTVKGIAVGNNSVYTREELEAIAENHPEDIKKILHGGIFIRNSNVFMAYRDGSEYMNHSFTPNSQVVYNASKDYKELVSYALRDIKAGDQITENYSNYFSHESDWVVQVMRKANSHRIEFQDFIRSQIEPQ